MSSMNITRQDQLLDLVQHMNEFDRVLLECRVVDGWSYHDIAVHLSAAPDVLVRRMQRLRSDLRQKAKAFST